MSKKTQKAILIDLIHPRMLKEHALDRMGELEQLVNTYGGLVIVKQWQKRFAPHPRTYIGTGKVEDLGKEAKTLGAGVVVVNAQLKPRQIYELSESLRKHKVQVWDRIDLILKIFAKHAKTTEAKLEIELASVRHMGPRIFGMGMELSRQGGGVGTVGIGETNTERMKRHLKEKERRIKKKLDKYKSGRALQRTARKRNNLKTVAIVGYTNAGKSTLLNTLTRKGAYAANKLFATLDTRVGKLFFQESRKEVLLSDTIGFIKDLPPELINAFASTLSEAVEADMLLHVADASDEHFLQHLGVVNKVLEQLKIQDVPRLLVLNKEDQVTDEQRERVEELLLDQDYVWISAEAGTGLGPLTQEIEEIAQP